MNMYFDIVCPALCFLFCVIHSIISTVNMHKQNKQIDKYCEKCLQPVESGFAHTCLDHKQLDLLIQFVQSVKGGEDGSSN
ncbi:hypothetical protein [Sigmofec virus UA08Rod_5550]|uniref:Uncharacterized protein n=1 Tax=Sigmofec virus UA08Rod_5550 TaxID=2929429 RepID=A0A976N244_9VIRU|nr:hypothetical protein [Sigmofec virus UA08Rod_5550]